MPCNLYSAYAYPHHLSQTNVAKIEELDKFGLAVLLYYGTEEIACNFESFSNSIPHVNQMKVTIWNAGNILYRVVEEALMDRLNTNMHEACLRIDKDCRYEMEKRTMLLFSYICILYLSSFLPVVNHIPHSCACMVAYKILFFVLSIKMSTNIVWI